MPSGSFSNVNLAVIVSDRSALVAFASEPLHHNVAKALYDKGAGCVVGLKNAYNDSQKNDFLKGFFTNLLNGQTAYNAALNAADDYLNSNTDFIIYGNSTFTLN